MIKGHHELVLGALLATAAWAVVAMFTANVNWADRIDILALPVALLLVAGALAYFAFRHSRQAIGVMTLLAAAAAAAFTGYAAYDAHINYTRTQRPFVTIKELKIDLVDGLVPGEVGKPGVPAKYWVFQPVLENSGNTLTKDLKIKIFAFFSGPQPQGGFQIGPGLAIFLAKDKQEPPDPADLSSDPRYKPPRYAIAPHASITLTNAGRTVEAFPADAPPWFLMGSVTYNDIFENTTTHQTKFCFQISGVPATGEQKPRAGSCVHWNCVDDECIEDRRASDAERLASK